MGTNIGQAIKWVWQVEGLHGLPAIAAPTFFPKASKNKDIWWETKTSLNTPRDDNENKPAETEDTGDPSDEQEEGDIKTTTYLWDSMDEEDREDTMDKEDCWGSKIKEWCRTGDIRVKKPKKTYECWVKNKTKYHQDHRMSS
jgi:hypothetical protein